MATSELGRRRNLLWGFLAVYVLLIVVSAVTQNPLASLLVDVFFAVSIMVVGALLFMATQGNLLGMATGAAFVGSGVAQAVELVTKTAAAGVVSDFLLVVGIACYFATRLRS